MIDYITITQKIKDTLLLEPFINKVTKGNLDDIANAKREEYGLAHIIMNNCTPSKSALTYNVSIICMDIVDIAKDETTDTFVGNSNEDFVLNEMHLVCLRMYELLRRGDLYSELYQLGGSVSLEPFTDRFEDFVAGWTLTIDIEVPNQITIC